MSHRGPHPFMRFVVFLLIIGVLFAIGSGIYRSGLSQGYAQGYFMGRASAPSGAAPAQPAVPVPGAPYGYYPDYYPGFAPRFGWGGGFSPFLGLLFCGGFFLLMLFVFGGIARRQMWKHRMAGSGPEVSQSGEHGPWGDWGHGPWGHGPWNHSGETPQGQQPGPQAQQPATPSEPPEQKPIE